MTLNEALPLGVLASSLLPGLMIFALPERRVGLRTVLNLFGALTKLVLVGVLLAGVSAGETYGFRHEVLPGLELVFKADALALLFVTLSTVLWLLTTVYAIGYLEGAPHRSRFFGFFSLCVTATMGIAMAGNLFTFFVFYELLTLSTFPLVAHRGTPQAMQGATMYLAYTLGGGALLLTGIVWLHGLTGAADFAHGGYLSTLGPAYDSQLKIAFLLLMAGVGVKAALVPLHGWLPQAMVAPAPVSALLWLLAGHYAVGYLRDDPARGRFIGLFCLTGLGNLLLPLAQDAAGFYLAFALMTFAAYGLVIHTGSRQALRAGRVYLIMALLGEMLLVTALWRLAQAAPGLLTADLAAAARQDPAACALLAAGFGVKVGVPLLHMWLPLAHPVAPTPASAVLSGAMIKAGVLGWLRFLPLGAVALPTLGEIFVGLGLAAAFLGVAVGLPQRDAKTVLAYSSISQMGYLTVAVGVGLADPALWPALAPAILVYAAHHGLAKGALFLGVGLPRGRWTLAGMALPALALAGAPFTSGALAKAALKAPLPEGLGLLLVLAAVGTSLLMLRLLWLAQARGTGGRPDRLMARAWAAGLVAVAGAPLALPMLLTGLPAPSAAGLWSALWPVLAGLALAGFVFLVRKALPVFSLPPGDLLAWLEPAATRLWRGLLAGLAWFDGGPRRFPGSGAR